MASVKATFITILLAVATIDAVAMRDIPEFLHICNTREANFEACITESIEYLKPYLKVGVPEYNIPSLEPLKLEQLVVAPTNSIRVQANNVNVHNSSNFTVSKLKIDLDRLLILVDVALPNIHVEGQYQIDGKVLLLPLRGSGAMHGNFIDCSAACRIQLERYLDENGVEKVRIVDFKMKISVGKGSLQLDNLFGGEQVLGEVINSAINNNFDLFLKELLPLVERALSDAFHNIADNIIGQFSIAQLFPNI